MAAVKGIEIGVEICNALNISTENVTNINIDIPADDVVLISVTRYADVYQIKKIKEIIKRYELHEVVPNNNIGKATF